MSFGVAEIASAVKYGLIALVAGALTWYALSTIQRASEADALELALKTEKAIAASKAKFDAKVDQLRTEFDMHFVELNDRIEQEGAKRRERIIEKLPANTRPCLTADVVRLLNGSTSDPARLPEATGSAHAGSEVISRSPGAGLRR